MNIPTLPYYVPYNISDHQKSIVLIANTTGRTYSSVSIDFDDGKATQTYTRNLDRIEYVYTTTSAHTLRLSAYGPAGVDVQLANIKIYENFDPYDSKTFFDYISATKNDYTLPKSRFSLAQSNDFVTADNINAAFRSIHDNLDYLETLCHRPDLRGKETILAWLGGPSLQWVQYDYGFLGDSSEDFISTNDNQLIQIENDSLNYLSAVGFNNIVDLAVKDDNNSGNTLYLLDGTNVVILSSDINATVLLSSGFIQFNKTFTTPNSIDVDSLDNVYVADIGNNEVYKFRNINGTLLLQTSVGGVGLSGDRYRLTAPNHVRIDSNDRVIISDRDNYAIKIYNSLLQWVNTIDVTAQHGKVLALAVDKRDDTIYVITEFRYLKKYTKDGSLISVTYLAAVGPSIRQCFVEFNSNFLYVITTGTAYKFTREGLFLKTMNVPESDGQATNDITTGRSDIHNQTFIGTRTKVFRIDSTPPVLNIKPYTEDLYYTFDEIKIQPKENVEDWIYNKALYRLIHNHIVFARNVFATYVRGVNTNNVLESFTIGPRDFRDVLTFEMSDDLYIGLNEPVLVNVVNRALEKIYDFQLKALDSIAPEIKTLFTIIPSLENDTVYVPTPTPTPSPTPTPTVTPGLSAYSLYISNNTSGYVTNLSVNVGNAVYVTSIWNDSGNNTTQENLFVSFNNGPFVSYVFANGLNQSGGSTSGSFMNNSSLGYQGAGNYQMYVQFTTSAGSRTTNTVTLTVN